MFSAAFAYTHLQFKVADGTSQHLTADGLVITFSSGNLTVNNTRGETLTLPLSSISSLNFSDGPTLIESINASLKDNAVTAYSINGVVSGRFSSYDEARKSLSPGIYILRDDNCNTTKILIGK